ncbi:DUF202 domain-containing protein [Micromonospora sp. NPDC005161]
MTGSSATRRPAGRHDTSSSADGDGGLQLERTMLAWRRTAAAFLVAAAVGARLLTPLLGGWAYPTVTAPSLCAFVIAISGSIPPLFCTPVASRPRAVTPRPGWMGVIAAFTCLIGLAAATAVLARAS